ncbi:RNA polymerase sigma factor [Spirosoma jeollabukense]
MSTFLTDEALIRTGPTEQDNPSFETLYTRYVGKVYGKCLSITRDSETARDFTQDIFLKVFQKLDTFEHRSSFSHWLYTVAYHYCMDQLKLAKRFPLSGLTDELAQHIGDLEAGDIHPEIGPLLHQALATLSAKEQALLRMKYEEGVSVEEIGQLEGLGSSAVKMRLKRSRAKIEAYFKTHAQY